MKANNSSNYDPGEGTSSSAQNRGQGSSSNTWNSGRGSSVNIWNFGEARSSHTWNSDEGTSSNTQNSGHESLLNTWNIRMGRLMNTWYNEVGNMLNTWMNDQGSSSNNRNCDEGSSSNNRNCDEGSSSKTRRESRAIKKRRRRSKLDIRLKLTRFRLINEELYMKRSDDAMKMFLEDPSLYKSYHSGFRHQTSRWPINPLDVIVNSIRSSNDFANKVMADFGCGDAELDLQFPDNQVHSFDLVAGNDRVTQCDMIHTNLKAASIDIAVYCLSLMSTNLGDCLKEANRVLKVGGLLKIAEVESRFENVDDFIAKLTKYGFELIKKNFSYELFYFLDFKKVSVISKSGKKKLPEVTLLPCLYKRR